jgi:hypothetical protein
MGRSTLFVNIFLIVDISLRSLRAFSLCLCGNCIFYRGAAESQEMRKGEQGRCFFVQCLTLHIIIHKIQQFMTNEIIALIANLALALSFIVAVIFGIAEVKAASRDRKERFTLETLRNFQTREFAEFINYITNRTMPSNRKELQALPVDEQVIFIQFGQQMESLGLLVAEKYIEIDLVDKTLGSFVMTAWQKYKTIFLAIREQDPFLGEYFQWLAEKIDERMRENPRKPFYKAGL